MPLPMFLRLLNLCAMFTLCNGNINSDGVRGVDCQHKATIGRDYRGTTNMTKSGIPCQRWSDTLPNDHDFTHVGDHNYCRNPVGSDLDHVWCITNDTDVLWEFCPVPFCHPPKVLDFSLDGDWKPDANEIYTHASLQKENIPSSFTICMAFMVEKWKDSSNSPLFVLLDSDDNVWLSLGLFAAESHTEFTIHFSRVRINRKSPHPFFPMQWTRVCISFNSDTSMVTLVVDGDQLIERTIYVDSTPVNLNLILGADLGAESPGRMTNVNMFSKPLSDIIREMTMAGNQKCGIPGDFVNWDEADWALHSKARFIQISPGRHVSIIQSNIEWGAKIIQFKIQFKIKFEIFIQSKSHSNICPKYSIQNFIQKI